MMRSVFDSLLSRTAALVVAGTAAFSAPAAAQLARPRTAAPDAPKLLILPFDRDGRDSALSLVVADGVRERMRTAHLDKFNTITRENLCRNLTESGFPCDVPLDAQTKRTLVRFLNTRYVIEGWMIRRGDSILVVARLSEASGAAPTAVSASVIGPAQRIGSSTGSELANRLVDGFRAFDEVAECRRRLDLQNYAGAIQRANEALRQSPNMAGAYLCIARVLEAQNGSADSIVGALRSAFEKDTLNTAVMRMLASKYEARHDTTRLVDMLKRILTIDFRDNDLRIATIRLMVNMGQVDSAIALVNKGLAENPASSELLAVKAIAMAQQRSWDSATTIMEQVADIDTSKVDSLFLVRVTNYARQIPDTTRWLRWVTTATVKYPGQLDNWYTLASSRLVQGDSSAAMSAAQGLLANLPAGGDTASATRGLYARANYVMAMVLNGRSMSDSALVHADRAIQADSTIRGSVAVVYYLVGARARGDSNYTRAIELLQKARDYGAGNRGLVVPASLQLGVAQVQAGVKIDAQADSSRNCDLARRSQEIFTAAEANVIAGAAAGRDIANSLLSQAIPAYKQRAEQLIRNNCR